MADSNPIFTKFNKDGKEQLFADTQHFTGSNDEGRARTGEKNPFPTTDTKVEQRLTAIEDKLDSVIENGVVNTQLTVIVCSVVYIPSLLYYSDEEEMLMSDKERVLTCYHCGNETVMKEISSYKHTEVETVTNYYDPRDSIEFYFIWKLYLCKVCMNVTLEQINFNNDDDENHKELLYPFKKTESDFIPKPVAGAYEAALKVRKIDGAICAIAIRRTLEMICKDKGAKGETLYHKLKNLSDEDILPPILEEMARVLRIIGNSAAHPGDDEFNHELVSYMLEFTKIILDYVYNLPNQIERVQKSVQEKNKKK
ncbi:DUF4145 domain-containing protein [Virgibacillus phage Mimir87]|nr:DUF4145 domain-containing protein [Virgibacillus phage Mimir87]